MPDEPTSASELPLPVANPDEIAKARVVQEHPAIITKGFAPIPYQGKIEVWSMLGGYLQIPTEVREPLRVLAEVLRPSIPHAERSDRGFFVTPHNGMLRYHFERVANSEELKDNGLNLTRHDGVDYVNINGVVPWRKNQRGRDARTHLSLLEAGDIQQELSRQGWLFFEPARVADETDPNFGKTKYAEIMKALTGLSTGIVARKTPLKGLVRVMQTGGVLCTAQANDLLEVMSAVKEGGENAVTYFTGGQGYHGHGKIILDVPHEGGSFKLVLRYEHSTGVFPDGDGKVEPLIRDVYFNVPFGLAELDGQRYDRYENFDGSFDVQVPNWWTAQIGERINDLTREFLGDAPIKEDRAQVLRHGSGVAMAIRNRSLYQKYDKTRADGTAQLIATADVIRQYMREVVSAEHFDNKIAQQELYATRQVSSHLTSRRLALDFSQARHA